YIVLCIFFFSSRRRHTRSKRDWSSDVCSSDLAKKQVDRFSGAEYKSFEKITDATEYLDWNKETQPDIVKEDSLSNAIKKIKSASGPSQANSKTSTDYFPTIYTD